MNDLISVIVPVYNAEKYLARCLESIINQSYKNLEIILVDDGSIDESYNICKAYSKKDNRIIVIHKKNGGVSCARNAGLDIAKGRWITFVDADDWIDANYCKNMIKIAIEQKSDYVCCGYKRIYKEKIELYNFDKKIIEYKPIDFLTKILNVQNGYGFSHMKLIKKDCIDNIKFDELLKVGEDAMFNILLLKKVNKVVVLNEPLYFYFFNEESLVRKFDINYADKYLQSVEKMKEYILSNYEEKDIIQSLYNYIVYHVLLVCVNYCFHRQNKQRGIKILKQVCKKNTFSEGIRYSNYEQLSLTRKISLFSLKHHMYLLMSIICVIRQIQFGR